MPSDRGTLQRGFTAGADQPPTWQEPTGPEGRRLPSAPRERKPALAALAVLLILGGALGAGFLVIQSGKRVAAIEITQQIGAGQRIPAAALEEVQIAAGTGLQYVPWAQAAQVTRFYAASAIPPGTLLTNVMVASSSTSTAGKSLLGLALKDGQLPRGLNAGDHVDIYQVGDSQETCPGNSGATLAGNAIVVAVSPAAASGSQAMADVEVAVNPADAGAVACNAANGLVGIAVLPNGGQGAASTGVTVPAGGRGRGGQPAGNQNAGTGNGGTGTAGTGTAGSGTNGTSGTATPGSGTGSVSPSAGAGTG